MPEIHPNDNSLHAPYYTPVYLIPVPQRPPLAISFLSAASFPLSLPPVVARGFGWPKLGLGIEGVNSRVGRWLLGILCGDVSPDLKNPGTALTNGSPDEKTQGLLSPEAHGPRIRGWVLMDYFDEPEKGGIVPLLVECNFHGRRPGEEGWPS